MPTPPQTQGSSSLATLGFVAESLRDSSSAPGLKDPFKVRRERAHSGFVVHPGVTSVSMKTIQSDSLRTRDFVRGNWASVANNPAILPPLPGERVGVRAGFGGLRPSVSNPISRRNFLRSTAAVSTFMALTPAVLGRAGETSPNRKLNIAGVGIGGQGGWDLEQLNSENIVAL